MALIKAAAFPKDRGRQMQQNACGSLRWIASPQVPASSPMAVDNWKRKAKRGPQGEYLEVIDWNGLEIVPVRKDFAVEHPATAARSEEQSEAIRARFSINVIHTPVGVSLPRPVPSFQEAPFPDWAQTQLRNSGFEQPTPIQVQAWPTILKGYDFVGIAETGSGKTLAYLLPGLVHIMAQPELKPGEGPVALILVPTRELCIQISKLTQSFYGCTGLIARGLYGGEDIDEQVRDIAKRMDVAVATPGRLIALLNSKVTNLRRATFIVLDEADELLGQGFGDQVRLILSQVRPDRQALLFSATWPVAVEGLASDVCSQQPIHVHVGSIKLSACKNITQRFRFVRQGESKFEFLCSALERIKAYFEQGQRALVFCNHKASVEVLVNALRERNFCCEGISGNQSQWDRDEVLKRFSQLNCNFDVLVCTQILGRGHDFRNVSFVVNFDMPLKMVEYVHRIGRTGRAGSHGSSLSLMLEGDLVLAKELKLVLRESEQDIPDEISRAATELWRYSGMPRSRHFNGHDVQPRARTRRPTVDHRRPFHHKSRRPPQLSSSYPALSAASAQQAEALKVLRQECSQVDTLGKDGAVMRRPSVDVAKDPSSKLTIGSISKVSHVSDANSWINQMPQPHIVVISEPAPITEVTPALKWLNEPIIWPEESAEGRSLSPSTTLPSPPAMSNGSSSGSSNPVSESCDPKEHLCTQPGRLRFKGGSNKLRYFTDDSIGPDLHVQQPNGAWGSTSLSTAAWLQDFGAQRSTLESRTAIES